MTYRTFDVAEIGHQQSYRLAIGSIVPRPIAWVSSMGADGVANLAPFSFFSLVSHYPPMVSISVGERARNMKDTARNIEATKGYVIHTVVDGWEDQMNASSADFAPDEDEFAAIGLETIPADLVDAPRIANAPVAMECRFEQMLELGDEWKTHLVIGRVLRWHVREDVMLDDKYIDPQKLAPVGRLGGPRYCRTHDIFEMKPPFTTPDRGHPNEPKT
jgi:flavin reductase (DIM6/NTAB) family NADH-FMN oxidoreductase RutF